METPFEGVVDAGVAIKLFVAESLSDRAEKLFALLAADPPARLFVPDLFYIECANILWKHVRRFGYPAEKARKDIANLKKLALSSIATTALAAEALEIALAHDVTAYDGCYIALANRFKIPFVTADEKLARMLSDLPYTILWLGDLAIPAGEE
jgi:predicted nucleic acid-binding protein